MEESHSKAIAELGDKFKCLNHFRTIRRGLRVHVAVVTLADGSCYVGEAKCSKKDQYVRRIGYMKSTGRAFGQALRFWHPATQRCTNYCPHFFVDPDQPSKELRDKIREILHIQDPRHAKSIR